MVEPQSGADATPAKDDPTILASGIVAAVTTVAAEAVLARTPLAPTAPLVAATIGATVGYALEHTEAGRELTHAFGAPEASGLMPDCLPQPDPISVVTSAIARPFEPAPIDPWGGAESPPEISTLEVEALSTAAAAGIALMHEVSHHGGEVICDPPGSISPEADMGAADPGAPPGDLV